MFWACSSIGRALPWHGRGRRFDPDQVHSTQPQCFSLKAKDAGVVAFTPRASSEGVADPLGSRVKQFSKIFSAFSRVNFEPTRIVIDG